MVSQIDIPQKMEIFYPESDGKSIADNTVQFRRILVIEQNLDWLYQIQKRLLQY